MSRDEGDENPDGHAERGPSELLALIERKHRKQQDYDGRSHAQQYELEIAARHAVGASLDLDSRSA